MMMRSQLDIDSNRQATKYSFKVQVLRVFWGIGCLFFRFSPRPFFDFRRFILRLFGAKVGKDTHVYNSAIIYFPWNLKIGDNSAIGEDALIYNLGKITIGDKVTISQRAHLCAGTHDYTVPEMPLIKPPIVVKDQAWICVDAFVGPNVTVDEGAVVGARAVVTNDVPAWTIMVGNPAKEIKKRVLKST